MPLFQYRGRNASGQPVNGRLEAASIDSVANELLKRSVIPIEIKPTKESIDWKNIAKLEIGGGKVSQLDITFFSRQLYTLLKAGVPIAQALKGLRDSAANPAFAKIIAQLNTRLEAGEAFTNALRQHPKAFNDLYVSLVSVGEETGNLPEVMLALSTYLQQEKEIRDRVKSAMRYPTFVMIAVVIALIIINVFVIPAFADMFSQFKAELPLPTRILMGTSSIFKEYWYLILGAVILVVALVKSYLKTPLGRLNWDKYKLKIPVMGSIIYAAAVSRFSRGFAITSRSGLPVVQGIPLISKALDNKFLEMKFDDLRQGVERGETIAKNAKRLALFPSMVIQMIEVGEETGQLEELLGEVADYFERDVDYRLKGLSAAIEPILITVIGGMVMIVMLGVFLPMWNMMDVMKGAK